MGSPLLEFSNSSIIVTSSQGEPGIIDGRYVVNGSSERYLVKCYLKRVQASSTDISVGEAYSYRDIRSGGVELYRYLYRGYCLGYSIISSNFEHGISDETNLVYTDIGVSVPSFLSNDIGFRRVSIRHGEQLIVDGYIEIIGGVYGSVGIDEIIYQNIGGVPITVRGSYQG